MRRLCWRWDGAEKTTAPAPRGERQPRPQSRTLFDRSWCVARERASAPEAPRFGAQVASSGGRSRRGKPEMPLAARRFFYLGPTGLDPALDGDRVALDGPTLRFLRAPAQRMQKPADVVDVITDAEGFMDNLGDTGTCPEVRSVARRAGASKESGFQPLFCLAIQLGRSTRQGLGPDGSQSIRQKRGFPAPNAATVNTDFAGNLYRLKSVLKKRDGAKASLFKELCASGWSHLYPPEQSIGHLIYRSQ